MPGPRSTPGAKTEPKTAKAPSAKSDPGKTAAPAPQRAATATTAKPRMSSASTATTNRARTLSLDAEKRRHYVEVAAYYIAERRGFSGGDETLDWLAAEEEIDRLLRENKLKI